MVYLVKVYKQVIPYIYSVINVLIIPFECTDYLLACYARNLLPQYNRVWIPDAEHVWKSAEIRRDFHFGDNVLELVLEDGTVSKNVMVPSHAHLVVFLLPSNNR